MSTEDIFSRLIEKAIAELHSDHLLIVLTVPTTGEWTKALLARFPHIGVIIHDDTYRYFDGNLERVGRRYGPDNALWQMPEQTFRDALVLGSMSQVGLRAIKAAISHGVRRLIFVDPIATTLSRKSIFTLGFSLGADRVITRWKRAASDAYLRARMNAQAVSRASLANYQGIAKSGWVSTLQSSGAKFHPSGLVRKLHPIGLVPLLVRAVQLIEARVSKRKEVSFNKTLEKLFQFSEQIDLASLARRSQSVVLAIGTVGPGGSERQVVNTALALSADGRFRPIVVCTNLDRGTPEFYRPVLESAAIELVDLKNINVGEVSMEHAPFVDACRIALANSKFDISNDTIKLLAFLLKEKPRVVHSFLDDTNIKAGVASVLARVPRTILSLRSVAPVNFSLHADFMRPGYEALLTRPGIHLCCNSNAGATDYRLWLNKLNLPIKIVENGIDFQQFVPLADGTEGDRPKYGIPRDVLVLGSIMRLTEEKQPMLWARVATEISRQMPDVHFVLVGDGPMKDQVMQFVSNARIASRVHFLGHIKDIPSVLRCFDLLLLTSRLEGLPNVLIEAQAVGVPVVTTPAGGAVETLDHGRTGLVAASQSTLDVADACMRILGDRQFRYQLSKAAPGFVREKFSLDRMLRKTLELYDD